MDLPKVVIIGGGFGGLNVTSCLKRAKFAITLIDTKNHHLFQPLLYQVATATLSPADIATPLREIFSYCENINVVMGTVIKIDKEKRKVFFVNGQELNYDFLVIAVGARHSYFGHDEWEKVAPGLKTIKDALRIRETVFLSFERAERAEDPKEVEKYLNFIVIGGGPTGVEMAGSIAEIARQALFKNFRRICPETAKVYLLEAAPRILPPYPESLSIRAKKDLESMGVKVITGQLVTNITKDGVEVGGRYIQAHTIIWAAGNQASPLLKTLNVPLDRQGRVIVQPDLSLAHYPEVFVIGDAACALGKDNKPLPAIAPVAIQQGRYVAKLLKKKISKKKIRPFKYLDKGSIATIGKNKAVGYVGGWKVKGFLAWIIWGFVHILYLVNYRSRFAVTLNWVFHYLTGMRSARLIQHSLEEEV